MTLRTSEQTGSCPRPAKRATSLARWSAAPVPPSPAECLSQARAGIACVQKLLTVPNADATIRTGICLREVADRLRQFQAGMAKTGAASGFDRPALIAAAAAAKEELAHANALFQQAGHFYYSWIRHFSALRCGYTRTGSPARLTYSGQSAVRG